MCFVVGVLNNWLWRDVVDIPAINIATTVIIIIIINTIAAF